MGLFDWLFGQFIDVIEWKDDSSNTIVWRYPRGDSSIKYGAKLIVRESQVAVFVDKGEIADILGPGVYELETSNLPILTDLQHWDHGFESPFKADVYFINTKLFSNLKWGTKNPILLRDPEFKMIRLRAYGTYEFRVKDYAKFLRDVVGTDGHFTTEELEERLANLIVTKLADALGEHKESILDLAASYNDFAEYIKKQLKGEFEKYGLELVQVLVENISLPKEVEEAIDKRSSREIAGDLNEHLKYQSAESLDKNNPASEMASIATGMVMANEINKSFNQNNTTIPTPPPIPMEAKYFIVKEKKAVGPFTKDDILEMLNQKTLLPESFIWKEGMKDWQKIKESELKDLLTKLPPKIPNS